MTELDREDIKAAVHSALDEHDLLSREDVRTIVRETVAETLRRVGVDPERPEETAAALHFVKEWRATTESIKNKTILAIVGVVVAGTLSALWLGFKAMLTASGKH